MIAASPLATQAMALWCNARAARHDSAMAMTLLVDMARHASDPRIADRAATLVPTVGRIREVVCAAEVINLPRRCVCAPREVEMV